MQLYSISFIHPYKQSGRWQDVLNIAAHAWKKYKTACTVLPEDEHLDVRNMSKTLQGC